MVQSQTIMSEAGFKPKLFHVCLLNRSKNFRISEKIRTRNFATEILKVYYFQPIRLVAFQVIKVKTVNVLGELGI